MTSCYAYVFFNIIIFLFRWKLLWFLTLYQLVSQAMFSVISFTGDKVRTFTVIVLYYLKGPIVAL